LEYVAQNATELVILDYATQEPVLYLPEAHLANLDVAGDYKLTSGGQQGLDILGWNRASGNSFVIYTPLLSMKFLELSTGSTLKNKTNDTITEIEQIEVDNTDEFETSYPIESIKVYQLNQSGRNILSKLTVESFDDTIVTLASATDGWLLIVYETISNTQELLIGKFQNKGFFSLLGEIDVYNRNDAIQEKLKFNFPKIDIINSFNVEILNNTDTNQMFAIQCQALVEESIDKSLIRIIKRQQG